MTFNIGDTVFITKLNKTGSIIEIPKAGLYKVNVGNFSIQCKAVELREAKQAKSRKAAKTQVKTDVVYKKRKKNPLKKIDLHGQNVEEAVTNVEKSINECILESAEKLEIIHGIGSGKLKKAVHDYLGSLSVVKHFRIDQSNAGTTWVYF